MKHQTKISLVIVAVVVALIGGYVAIDRATAPSPAEAAAGAQVVRADSHRLGERAPRGSVTVTEFLDFECEACRAAYPLVEELRQRYAGRVTFVMRYFPGPSHANARNAAHAVEAAARQDRLEPMYSTMFRTQAEWGEVQESRAAVFRRFAADLGLDLDRYDADVASQEVADRVQRDFDEGLALGVQGTPTFFVDDERVELRTADDLTRAIDRTLADRDR